MNGQYNLGDMVPGNWTLTRLIGESNYGRVFEAERKDSSTTHKSAIKIITIPQSQTEVENVRAEGMSDEAVTGYFHGYVEEVVRRFALIAWLKDTSNVVSYEDYTVVQHDNSVAWDIIIRMELLTPLLDHCAQRQITRQMVIKLGIDICRALELCQNYKIVHRDIKPENIFVSVFNDYKLGDFGIARTVEKMLNDPLKKGVYTFMAPEVIREEPYDSGVDIYSLGIILYWLLNDNRVPFLPGHPAPITPMDEATALMKRISGARLSAPKNADGKLAEIVLKASAYDPKERYSTPIQMRHELEAILYSRDETPIVLYKGDDTAENADENTPRIESPLIQEPSRNQYTRPAVAYEEPWNVPGRTVGEVEYQRGKPTKETEYPHGRPAKDAEYPRGRPAKDAEYPHGKPAKEIEYPYGRSEDWADRMSAREIGEAEYPRGRPDDWADRMSAREAGETEYPRGKAADWAERAPSREVMEPEYPRSRPDDWADRMPTKASGEAEYLHGRLVDWADRMPTREAGEAEYLHSRQGDWAERVSGRDAGAPEYLRGRSEDWAERAPRTETPETVESTRSRLLGKDENVRSRPIASVEGTSSKSTDKPDSVRGRPVDKPDSMRSRPMDIPDSTRSKPADMPDSTRGKPIDKAESTRGRPIDKAESTLGRSVDKAESTRSRPIDKPESTRSRPIDKPEGTRSRPIDKPESSTRSRPIDEPESTRSKPADKAGISHGATDKNKTKNLYKAVSSTYDESSSQPLKKRITPIIMIFALILIVLAGVIYYMANIETDDGPDNNDMLFPQTDTDNSYIFPTDVNLLNPTNDPPPSEDPQGRDFLADGSWLETASNTSNFITSITHYSMDGLKNYSIEIDQNILPNDILLYEKNIFHAFDESARKNRANFSEDTFKLSTNDGWSYLPNNSNSGCFFFIDDKIFWLDLNQGWDDTIEDYLGTTATIELGTWATYVVGTSYWLSMYADSDRNLPLGQVCMAVGADGNNYVIIHRGQYNENPDDIWVVPGI